MSNSTRPRRSGPTRRDPMDRFWDKVEIAQGCWNWLGGKTKNGYGVFGVRREGRAMSNASAHRYAWEMANGPILDGLLVDHTCHNRACVRPSHLRLVTPKQNLENLSATAANSNTGVLGVSWDKVAKKYRAVVGHNHKHVHVGRYATLEEAAAAVKAKRLELFTHNLLDRA